MSRFVTVIAAIAAGFAVTAVTASTVVAADATARLAFPVEDTPKNRAIAAATYKQYLDAEKKYAHTADLDGIKMQYLEYGDASEVPLFWSPGFTGSAFDLFTLGPQLAAAGYHVFSMSHRGHGKTQVADTSFTLYTMADDAAALMDKVGIRCAVIGGTSLGAFISSAFYDDHHDHVLAMVLGAGGTLQRQRQLEMHYRAFIEKHPDLQGPIVPYWAYDDKFLAFRAMLNDLLPDTGNSIPVEFSPFFWSLIKQDASGKYLRATPVNDLVGNLRDFVDPSAGYRVPAFERSLRSINPETIYRNLDVPMLAIEATGTSEIGDDAEANREWAKKYPDLVTAIEYPHTEHAFTKIHPDWFLRDMTAFLKTVKAHPVARCMKP